MDQLYKRYTLQGALSPCIVTGTVAADQATVDVPKAKQAPPARYVRDGSHLRSHCPKWPTESLLQRHYRATLHWDTQTGRQSGAR